VAAYLCCSNAEGLVELLGIDEMEPLLMGERLRAVSFKLRNFET